LWKKNLDQEELLLRGQSIFIKLLSDYAAVIGKNYIINTLRPILAQMNRETESKSLTWEVNPDRAGKFLKKNQLRVNEFANKFLYNIIESEEEVPP
jgi:hypothetical protein